MIDITLCVLACARIRIRLSARFYMCFSARLLRPRLRSRPHSSPHPFPRLHLHPCVYPCLHRSSAGSTRSRKHMELHTTLQPGVAAGETAVTFHLNLNQSAFCSRPPHPTLFTRLSLVFLPLLALYQWGGDVRDIYLITILHHSLPSVHYLITFTLGGKLNRIIRQTYSLAYRCWSDASWGCCCSGSGP